jgi:iron complex transport system ATP-binding protein
VNTILAINHLVGGYLKEMVIKDVSLEITKGDFLGIIGPNGCGKTTLLRLASRVLTPQRGSITLQGKNIAAMPLKEFCQETAFVGQDTSISFPFTVFEIVLLGRIPYLRRWQGETKRDIAIAENALILTDIAQLKQKRIDELSSGERQRVIIAKALAQQPSLLFLDEPTAHLDIGHQIQVLDLLKKLNEQKSLTIVIVLHDLNLASAYCNRLILLDKGRVFKTGVPSEVLTYQNIEAVYKTLVVVENNPVNRKPHVFLVSGVN